MKKDKLLLMIIPVLLFAGMQAVANSYFATNSNDSGPGSLRQAILDANASPPGPHTIFCSATGTVNLLSDLPNTLASITINGPGANSFFISGGNKRFFPLIASTYNVTVNGITFCNSIHPSWLMKINAGGSLTLNNCVFSGCATGGGACIYNTGSLTLINCTVKDNSTAEISTAPIISSTGTTQVTTFTGCTFSNNTTHLHGGAYLTANGISTITNCTFSSNVSDYGGAMYLSGGAPVITVTNCTFYGNNAINGGAIFVSVQATLYCSNSIFVGNSAIATGPDGYGTINSGYGHNILQSLGGVVLTGVTTGNQTGLSVAAVLNPVLSSNGGPTQTHALVTLSPALNNADPFIAPLTDQRGFPRIMGPDVGAYEGNSSLLPVELISFDATPSAGVVNCRWTTASENNNDHFTLEKSSDGKYFSPLAVITGAGSSSSLHSYAYTDDMPLPGISYYRLSQTDFNGHTVILATASVRLPDGQEADAFYHDGCITVTAVPEDAKLLLYDARGTLVMQKQLSGSTACISAPHLTNGLYTLQLLWPAGSKAKKFAACGF